MNAGAEVIDTGSPGGDIRRNQRPIEVRAIELDVEVVRRPGALLAKDVRHLTPGPAKPATCRNLRWCWPDIVRWFWFDRLDGDHAEAASALTFP